MARYRDAVRWIALNDEPTEGDVETISQMISVILIADIFGKEPVQVARDVQKQRDKDDQYND